MNKEAALQKLIDSIGLPVERGAVSAGGIQTAYLAAGSGEPVVLLHGASAAGITWHRVIEPLAERFRVFAPDIVGHGESGQPGIPYDRTYLSAWLAGFLDALGLHKVHLVGHSLGGALALRFTLEHSPRVERLVLVDAAGLTRGVTLDVAVGFFLYLLFPCDATRLRLARLAVHRVDSIDPLLGEYMRQLPTDPLGRRLRLLLPGHRRSAVPFTPHQLGLIEQPTLIIWGREERFFPVAVAEAAAKAIPHARLHVIPEAGHVPFFDQPEVCNEVLLDFLVTETMEERR